MNTTIAEGLALVDAMLPGLQRLSSVERVVCPPFVSLAAIAERLRGTDLRVGAQNVSPEPKGAFTGEVSLGMLDGLAQYVIIGHSERRQYFAEDDAFVHRKMVAVLDAGLTPILCVGETLEQHEAHETDAVVTGQVRAAIEGVGDLSRVVVAYEPIWAIGTGRAATPEGANATIATIRSVVGDNTRIQYGGSVTAENFGAFIAQPDIDGALVGGASLRADQFVEIVRLAATA
ncbi:MAG: triose-phosphate isomerase [Chloroflexi bacterium]|nr:triose-phosphate isomerase [Chloroflexota bacterium]MBV9548000.1 triose-phosphate isomerase [Chloroflexota bacterium]